MPGEFYDKAKFEKDKATLEARNAAIELQLTELESEKDSNEESIEQIDAILAYISAGYPAIVKLDPPANAAGVAVALAGVYSSELSWDAVTDATGYIVERATNPSFNDAIEVYNDAANEFTDDDEDLTYNRVYYYRIKAIADGKQDSDWATVDVAMFMQLGTPVNILLDNVAASGEVTGTWDAVIYASEYKVWRHTADDFAAATMIIEDLATPAFTDDTVVNGTPYWYWITAHATTFLTSDPGEGGSITPSA